MHLSDLSTALLVVMSSTSALLVNPNRWLSSSSTRRAVSLTAQQHSQIRDISGCRYLSRLDASKDNDGADEPLPKQASWQNPRSSFFVDSLLQKTVSRATSTLSTTTSGKWDDADSSKTTDAASDTISSVVDAAIIRSSSVLSEAADEPTFTDMNDENNTHQDNRTYLNNPCVTPTALAHTLWKSTIIPYHDTVIDATCGNGKDCLALAKMLFPGKIDPNLDVHPQLVGIDIQSRAITNTRRSLLSTLPEDVYYNHVTLLERSHEHLLDIIAPREDGKKEQVGLICYNLGYLPGGQASNDNYKECKTQMQTTLSSITDAALLLRVGGLLSIMTYPGSNLEESIAVEHFVEGLAMLTTRDIGGWRGYLESIPDICNDEEDNHSSAVRDVVSRSIERIVSQGSPKQTWRAFVHKPLGRPLSPILVTAHRIK